MSLSSEERKDILQQLAGGEITVADASVLLNERDFEGEEKLEHPFPEPDKPLQITKEDFLETPAPPLGEQPTWFHIRVNDLKSGKNRVTVNIPLRLVNMGLKIGRRFAPELEVVDWQELKDTFNEEKGVLIDVTDESDGEQVLIYVD
ncbi:MAG: hypothetical protein BMS9Abin02_1440 [Anaerolineae bacterium]|nr:MAG: hypothetical protein BMS9Abin02_1440 [Anaerolineae bacterium]